MPVMLVRVVNGCQKVDFGVKKLKMGCKNNPGLSLLFYVDKESVVPAQALPAPDKKRFGI